MAGALLRRLAVVDISLLERIPVGGEVWSAAPGDVGCAEMLYGYVAAIVGGFLLTAILNWTGRCRSTAIRF